MSSKKKEFLNKTKENFYNEIKKFQKSLKPTKEIEGFGTLPIVSEKNYPLIKTHSISNPNLESSYAYSNNLVKKNYKDIIKINAKNILGSTNQIYIKKINKDILQELQNIYKAKKPTEFTSKFENEIKFNTIVVSKFSGILGSKNSLEKINPNQNIQTSKAIEYYTQEDVRSKEAIIKLYEKGLPEQQIISMLSLGLFGVSFNKKLVPTKWAISAYDQTIEKYLHKKILHYRQINSYEIYYHKDKGNEFLIILIPNSFRAQIIEQFSNVLEQDYVGIDNKLNKPEPETAGGFYATKLAIFENLSHRKKQASIISIRFIEDYELPLGVIFVRESVREAMKNQIFKTTNEKEFEEFLFQKYLKQFKYYKNSKLYKEIKKTKQITDYF